MILLTQRELGLSKNHYLKELAANKFVFAPPMDSVQQIINDAPRGLLINGQPIPPVHQKKDTIIRYLSEQLGQEHSKALLTSYCQSPMYTLPTALMQACVDEQATADPGYFFSAANSRYNTDIFVKNNVLYYVTSLEEIELHNGKSLAGQARCVNVYIKSKQAFVTQEVHCSNSVLKDMLIDNKFEYDASLFQAQHEEAHHPNAIKLNR